MQAVLCIDDQVILIIILVDFGRAKVLFRATVYLQRDRFRNSSKVLFYSQMRRLFRMVRTFECDVIISVSTIGIQRHAQ